MIPCGGTMTRVEYFKYKRGGLSDHPSSVSD